VFSVVLVDVFSSGAHASTHNSIIHKPFAHPPVSLHGVGVAAKVILVLKKTASKRRLNIFFMRVSY
jgi:hypothetical protein